MANNGIRPQILGHLQALPPLTVVKLTDLYELPFARGKEDSVRSALYGLCAGTPVSQREQPRKIYGIRLRLSGEKHVVLSLPGILREYVQHDHESDMTIERIIRRLKGKYGATTIDFWAKAAQRRSVDQASSGMRAAKSRDGHSCLLCKAEGICDPRPITACHIISRKASFWLALDEVEKTKGAIFTEEATRLLSARLKKRDVHSDPRFIVTLCKEHNDLLLDALTTSLSRTEKPLQDQISLFEKHHSAASTPVEVEKLVEIGGEGGNITLYGSRYEGSWRYRLVTDESGLVKMAGETPPRSPSFKGGAKTWGGALKLLSRYPWKKLYPLYVHPEFTDLIANEISKRGLQPFEREHWHAVLFPKRQKKDVRSDGQLYAKKTSLLRRAIVEANRRDEEGL